MKKVAFVLAVVVILGSLMGVPVLAAENEFGNAWVYDEAQMVSDETEEYIRALNEDVFAGYQDRPQLAIVVVNDLPYNMDSYKQDLFNEFGVGTAEENCGMLFLLAINDREYAIEIGDGFEKGSLLRKYLEKDFITEDMKDALRAGDYDSVVRGVARYLEGLMADEENGVFAQREAEMLAANTYALNFRVSFPRTASLIFASPKVDFQDCSFLIQNVQTGQYLVGEYSEKDQAYLVSGSAEYERHATRFCCGMTKERPGELFVYGLKAGAYRLVQASVPSGFVALGESSVELLAEQAVVNGNSTRYKVYGENYYVTPLNIRYSVNETEQAVLTEDRSLSVFGIILCIGCPVVGLVVLGGFILYKVLRTRKIKDLIEQNYKYVPSAKTTREEFLEYMKTEQADVPYWELDEKFLGLLFQYYIETQLCVLTERAQGSDRLRLYKYEFQKVNDMRAFMNGRLTSVDTVIYNVDAAEQEKEEMEARNAEIVEQFFSDNEYRIENKAIAGSVRMRLEKCVRNDRVLEEQELEAVFVKAVEEMGFRWEFDRFCKENGDQIDKKDFDQERFYREVTSTDNYQNYRNSGYRSRYDRSWMMPLLVVHMSQQRKRRQEREQREEAERQARERRRKQEEARRAAEMMRSNNSSFGSSFGGGRSSGGGFKGKW